MFYLAVVMGSILPENVVSTLALVQSRPEGELNGKRVVNNYAVEKGTRSSSKDSSRDWTQLSRRSQLSTDCLNVLGV
jgi:hypothetical protein